MCSEFYLAAPNHHKPPHNSIFKAQNSHISGYTNHHTTPYSRLKTPIFQVTHTTTQLHIQGSKLPYFRLHKPPHNSIFKTPIFQVTQTTTQLHIQGSKLPYFRLHKPPHNSIFKAQNSHISGYTNHHTTPYSRLKTPIFQVTHTTTQLHIQGSKLPYFRLHKPTQLHIQNPHISGYTNHHTTPYSRLKTPIFQVTQTTTQLHIQNPHISGYTNHHTTPYSRLKTPIFQVTQTTTQLHIQGSKPQVTQTTTQLHILLQKRYQCGNINNIISVTFTLQTGFGRGTTTSNPGFQFQV